MEAIIKEDQPSFKIKNRILKKGDKITVEECTKEDEVIKEYLYQKHGENYMHIYNLLERYEKYEILEGIGYRKPYILKDHIKKRIEIHLKQIEKANKIRDRLDSKLHKIHWYNVIKRHEAVIKELNK